MSTNLYIPGYIQNHNPYIQVWQSTTIPTLATSTYTLSVYNTVAQYRGPAAYVSAFYNTTTGRFAIPVTGVYMITVNWTASTWNASRYQTDLRLNGLTETETFGYGGCVLSTTRFLTARNYMEVYYYQTSGSTQNVAGDFAKNKCTIFMLS